MRKPSYHFGAVKRILRYISGTLNHGILYTANENFNMVGHSDSDWGRSVENRRSTTGWIFSLGSGAIAWSSKKQAIAALSSTEAEYIALTSTACEAVWLIRLLEDLNEEQVGSTVINCDNKSAISIAKNPIHHGRTKHIDAHYHFIRDLVKNKQINIVHCGTDDQVAYAFTKALNHQKFEHFGGNVNLLIMGSIIRKWRVNDTVT